MAARKTKPPALRQVSRQAPTESETDAVASALVEGPPIVAAVLAQSILDNELERLLRAKMKRTDQPNWDRVTGENGPLGTFYQKALMAHALGFIDDVTLKNVGVVRDIRNAFAHSKLLLDFEHDAVRREIEKVAVIPGRSRRSKWLRDVANLTGGARHAFLTLWDNLAAELAHQGTLRARRQTRHLKGQIQILSRKVAEAQFRLSLAEALSSGAGDDKKGRR